MRLRKILAVLPVLTAVLLGACQANTVTQTTTAAAVTETTTTTAATEPAYTTTALTPANEYPVPELTFEQADITMNEALEFVRDMKLGWNLGNTFDASDARGYSVSTDLQYESMWCGAKTTKDMIDNLKAAGFNTIRFPASWHNHVTDDSFTISEAWLDRYQEVVDYAIDNGMYAIINIHHDIDNKFYYPDSAHYESSKAYSTAIWKQLADRFKDYDDHLIFESINEPRLTGTNDEWATVNAASETQMDSLATIVKLNQDFVDTVRATGGNNASRYLMCPSYAASADNALNSSFTLPTDTADNRIIVSVHAYTPYNFALAPTAGYQWEMTEFDPTNPADTRDIDNFMSRLYDKYISKGIPVVIGEFGARDRDSNIGARVNFSAYYIGKARSYGITGVWWDNNAFSGTGENFGILDRQTNTFKWTDLVQALVQYS
jgi:endoglucanase